MLLLLLLHLELLGLLGLHHPHLGMLDLLLRHPASPDALAHGRSRHHTPTAAAAAATRSRHTAEAAGPCSPLGAGEGMLPLAEGQVLLPGGLLLVGDEALDDPAVGGAAGAHPRRTKAGSPAGAATSTAGGTTGRRRVGRDVVVQMLRVGGRLGHHTRSGNAVVAVGGSTTTPTSSSSSAATTAAWNARSNHGLELGDAIIALLDLSLQLGDLRGILREGDEEG